MATPQAAEALNTTTLDGSTTSATLELFRAALGPLNTDYYLKAFTRFDAADRAGAHWNWAACLCTLNWLALRQLWGAALAYTGTLLAAALLIFGIGRLVFQFSMDVQLGLLAALGVLAFALPGLFGNALLYNDCRKKMEHALSVNATLEDACAMLKRSASSRQRMIGLAIGNALLIGAVVGGYVAFPDAAHMGAGTQTSGQARNAAMGKTLDLAAAPGTPASAATGPVVSAASALATSVASAPLTSAASAPVASAASAPVALVASAPVALAAPAPAATASAPGVAASAPLPAASGRLAVVSAPSGAASAPLAAASKSASVTELIGSASTTRLPAKASAPQPGTSKPAPLAKPAVAAKPKPATKITPASDKPKAATPKAKPASVPASTPASTNAAKNGKVVASKVAENNDKRFVINVGLFADENNTRNAFTKLSDVGLNVLSNEITTKKGKLTRIRVGPFPTQAEADRAAEKIRSLKLDAVVVPQ